MIIYESKKKIINAIDTYDKSLWERVDINSLNFGIENISVTIGKKDKNLRQCIEDILASKKKLYDMIKDPVYSGVYYKIKGDLVYKNKIISGLSRKLANKKLLEIATRDVFFEDDQLFFDIISIGSESYDKIEIKCSAKNISCFSQREYDGQLLMQSDSSDVGVLCRKIPVEVLVMVNKADPATKRIEGNCVYIRMINERF